MTGSENVDGYFYLTCCGQQTRLMSIGVTADDLEDAIVSELCQSIPCQLKMKMINRFEVNHGPFIYNHLTTKLSYFSRKGI